MGYVGVERMVGYVSVVALGCLTESTTPLKARSGNSTFFGRALVIESEMCHV